MKRKRGAVYVARWADDSPVKIGFTSKPLPDRLKSLQSLMPYRLYFVSAKVADTGEEKRLHKLFADCKMLSEWFEPSLEIEDYIRANPMPRDPIEFDRKRYCEDYLEKICALDEEDLFKRALNSLDDDERQPSWRWYNLYQWRLKSYCPTEEEAKTVLQRMRELAPQARAA